MLQTLLTINEYNMPKAAQNKVKFSSKWVVLLPNSNPYQKKSA